MAFRHGLIRRASSMTDISLPGLTPVLYSTEDEDVTLGTWAVLDQVGEALAREMGCQITARDPVTDRVIKVFAAPEAAR
jgi:hypothetical protein